MEQKLTSRLLPFYKEGNLILNTHQVPLWKLTLYI